MDIKESLDLIKTAIIGKKVIESKHFENKCVERCLDIFLVRTIIYKNEIIGILTQNKRLYKIWFEYNEDKDLNIILRVLDDKSIKLVTIFPCPVERRLR